MTDDTVLEFTSRGIFCPQGDFYIDPWQPVDRAIITHAHADHARAGMGYYLCHQLSKPALRIRLGNDIKVQSLAYEEPLYIQNVRVSLHPAGHVIGSAQVRLEYKGKVVVVSGDYKLQHDELSTPFQPIKCHEFITESTFGLPIYRWDKMEEQYNQLRNWVIQNKLTGNTSVLFGYSLGKAQRIMHALRGIDMLYVHPAIGALNEAYMSAGIALPPHQLVNLNQSTKHLAGGVIILPPVLFGSTSVGKIPHKTDAICSGWMRVRGARRWRSADAGFPISDHADWNGLLTTVQATGAEKIYVVHGHTAALSRYLNENGFQAEEVRTRFGDSDQTNSQ